MEVSPDHLFTVFPGLLSSWSGPVCSVGFRWFSSWSVCSQFFSLDLGTCTSKRWIFICSNLCQNQSLAGMSTNNFPLVGDIFRSLCCTPWAVSNLMYCLAGAISSPQRGTQCAELTKIIIIRRVEGRSRSEIRNCGCDQEGRTIYPKGCIGKQVISHILLRMVSRTDSTTWEGML